MKIFAKMIKSRNEHNFEKSVKSTNLIGRKKGRKPDFQIIDYLMNFTFLSKQNFHFTIFIRFNINFFANFESGF